MNRHLMVVLAMVLAVAARTGMRAQSPTFRAAVDAVEVDVSVTRGGRSVAGLTAENFGLQDNGVAQRVSVSPLADVPLRVVLTLDTSGSVRGRRLEQLIKAGQTLAKRLKQDDQIALVTFSEQPRLLVPMGPAVEGFQKALAGLTGVGPTALRDAVLLALASQSTQRARSLMLLFSDGLDTVSWTSTPSLIEAARRSSSVIHAVRFQADPFLDRLALTSGGRTWSATSDDQLESLFTRALDEMRARYVLSYSLGSPTPTPGWHEIKVSLRNARGDVTARPGYVVP